jgi:two-component system, NtrC family, C4-dicarboxylate transport sensor histidine kinase DctB
MVSDQRALGDKDQLVIRSTNRHRFVVAAAVLGGVMALVWLALQVTTTLYLTQGQTRAKATLALTVQALDGHLRRYEAIPDLLAEKDDVLALLENPDDPVGRLAMNQWLAQQNAKLDSADIYVMTPDGVTIAASNYERANSFLGQNFSFRPYFAAALAGKKGHYYAIGTTSRVRGYYFAAPVRGASGRVAGVVAVKVGLDEIEAEWRRQEAQIIVTDPEGIIFLSTEPDWLYRGLLPLTEERLATTAASLRYAGVVPTVLPNRLTQRGALTLLTPQDGDRSGTTFVVSDQTMPRADWKVQVLLDTAPFNAQARVAVLAVLMFLGALAATIVLILQRRARLAEQIALRERAQAELESRVIARTADLARANALIETEVAERRATEAELRRTQGDLVQAGKLAALGQMSAALSHEINQPLAAARNYADSAAILIDRGDKGRAKENVGQILTLIDRMAAIARHLRQVARKPETPLQDIVLADAIDEALKLINLRLDTARAAVSIVLPDDLPKVRAGPVRLQQVLVNILSNAVDAIEGADNRVIEVTASVLGEFVQLNVRDHGQGVPAAIAARIFDPFFTTKRVGAGLGLGLSISYNIMKDFGGDLRVANHADGGAVFTVELVVAAARREAAE